MVTTVAPTMPVLAASSMPTSVTEMPRPPRSVPNKELRVSSNSSAMRARSSVIPMNTNKGTATSVSLVMMPNTRLGSPDRKAASKPPPRTPPSANKRAVPPRENATGKPASSSSTTATNSSRATHSIVSPP